MLKLLWKITTDPKPWVVVLLFFAAAAFSILAARAAGIGCLLAGVIIGVLTGPMIAKWISSDTPVELKRRVKDLESQVREYTERNERLEADLHAANDRGIQTDELGEICQMLLLDHKSTFWDFQQYAFDGDGKFLGQVVNEDSPPENTKYVFRGLQKLRLERQFGVKRLKVRERSGAIEVYGFEKNRVFTVLPEPEILIEEVREKNVIFPGNGTFHRDERSLRARLRQEGELRRELNRPSEGETYIDDRLREVAAKLIQRIYRTAKPITFVEGAAPQDAQPLVGDCLNAPRL